MGRKRPIRKPHQAAASGGAGFGKAAAANLVAHFFSQGVHLAKAGKKPVETDLFRLVMLADFDVHQLVQAL